MKYYKFWTLRVILGVLLDSWFI